MAQLTKFSPLPLFENPWIRRLAARGWSVAPCTLLLLARRFVRRNERWLDTKRARVLGMPLEVLSRPPGGPP